VSSTDISEFLRTPTQSSVSINFHANGPTALIQYSCLSILKIMGSGASVRLASECGRFPTAENPVSSPPGICPLSPPECPRLNASKSEGMNTSPERTMGLYGLL
jgi:hypothetical protein